ncbi:MAG: prenyltransferase, partial [Burkholderiales bacterium]
PLAAGVPIALLVAAILHAAGFPDRTADAAAGKDTIVVRLGPRRAAWAYLALVAAAYLWLIAATLAGAIPSSALAGLLAAPLSLFAARQLILHAGRSPTQQLLPAIKATIAAAHLHGLLVAAALLLSAA